MNKILTKWKERIRQKPWLYNLLKSKKYFQNNIFRSFFLKFLGFRPDDYFFYNFKSNSKKKYITQVERIKTRNVNKQYNIILDDKLVFYHMFSKYLSIPTVYGWIINNQIFDLNGSTICFERFIDLLNINLKLVLKPNMGASGTGVYCIEYIDKNNCKVNEEIIDNLSIFNKILTHNDYLITGFIKQHSYSEDIYEHTTNTLRVITIINDTGVAEIPIALQRVGTKNTIPVDNASKGGIFSMICLQSGVLTSARSYWTTEEFEFHPDSGNQIKGVEIPYWNKIKNEIICVASKFQYIPFMAWDVVVTSEGFSVLEINASTDLQLIQIFEPQRYSKLGDFYRKKGVIK